ncbi:MAG: ATP-NAD kinase family protein [Chloroflexota bacterium]|nr:ATP-NAD kinase family protein [Chloroflexota bacterium]
MKETRVGLIVNPVAGMGGSVGLKGTDGEMHEKALELGAEPVTPKRTRDTLAHIERGDEIAFLAAPGEMGAAYLREIDVPVRVIGDIGPETSAEDTKRIAEAMVADGVELLIFVGGDGTARDIYDAVGTDVPVVGVPAGVKVFSSAFALSARAAAEMVDAFLTGGPLTEEEVLDIDEEAYRDDKLASRLYGTLLVPEARALLQPAKAASDVSTPSEQVKRDIASFIVDEMKPGTLYLLGPGTTVRAITEELGLSKTLLGVDAVHDGTLVGEDLNEQDILGLLEQHGERKIVVTPIGGNGFIFGRGSKQFTPTVIRAVGREHVMVVGTRQKVRQLDCLRVDTGDLELDEILCGYIKVAVGYREWMMVEVRC